MTTNNSSNYQPIQNNIISGGINNQINNITPGTTGSALTSNGPNAQSTFQTISIRKNNYLLKNIQTFSTPGTHTYTPTSGMIYCIIQCQAPGGGGAVSATTARIGGCGGGGGYAQRLANAATIGTSQSITIGVPGSAGAVSGQNGFNGGTTSVGALLSCTGGRGGFTSGTCGMGGQATGGNLNISGQNGHFSTTNTAKRTGGNSWLGFGAQYTGASFPNGGNYGGGGVGLDVVATGSSGGPGIVVITEYLSP